MNEQSSLFVKNCFRRYYQLNKPNPPDNLPQREWAFVSFDRPGMFRHLSLDQDTLNTFLVSRVPRHVYYSAARWQNPNGKKMNEMDWLGADLIFDVDCKPERVEDHPTCLQLAKQEMLKRIDCLRHELGFHDLDIVFSGWKGYHCHVIDESLTDMDNKERREIMDYITGNNCLSIVCFRQIGDDHIAYLPGIDASGRAGRFRDTFAHEISKQAGLDESDQFIENLIKIKGIGLKRARAICNSIILNNNINNAIKCDGSTMEGWKILFDHVQSKANIQLDQQVTVNSRHVIRLPETLHGGSGLKVMRVKDLESFDPLTDAVCLSDRVINMITKRAFKMEIDGQSWRFKEGEAKVKEYLAVYSICHSMAEIAI